ncbi:MAG: hypothetical protein ACLS2V_13030 [Clostridium paraputrificum]
MEIDLKKVFYIIVCVVLIGLIGINLATPTANKIKGQKESITTIDFTAP